jgi:capsular exopolysaccharide synthesis family protein
MASAMDEERPELDWHFYFGVLRRRYPIIILVTLLAVGVAFARSATATRIYEASTLVLITDPGKQTVLNDGDGPEVDIPTEIQLIYSGPIQVAANRALGADAARVSSLSIVPVGDTYLIRITAQSASPRVAQRAANAYAEAYVNGRQQQATESADRQILILRNKLTELNTQLAAIDGQIQATGALPGSDLALQRTDLLNQIATTNQRVSDLQLQSELRVIGGALVVQEAGLPQDPVEPTPMRDILLGFAVGLVLGLGLAFLAEFLDDKIKTAADIARYGGGLTTLAEVPTITRTRNNRRLVALDDPASGAAETYRSLRTSLRLIALRSPIGTLLVTSSMAGEGKTTTVANLGVTMARAGVRVVLIDLDLRRSNLGEMFGGDEQRGLMSVLVGEASLDDVMIEVPVATGVPPLHVLPAGALPPNPSEVMSTGRLADVLTTLRERVDLVIIDSPPIIPVTDAVVLSARVDSVLMIVKAGRTRRRHLARAREMLGQADAPMIGAVLNDAGRHVRYGYYQRYGMGRKKSRYYGRGREPRPISVEPSSVAGNGSNGKVRSPLQTPPES